MIGVLGGMGPESTAYAYMCMVRCCQQKYGASLDSDFPPIMVYSMPVPDVVDGIGSEPQVLAMLKEGIMILKGSGADFSFIACNSMQSFVPELRKSAEVLSIVEEVAMAAKRSGSKGWGLLATATTIGKGCYQDLFEKQGMEIVCPDAGQQAEVTAAIREILQGRDMSMPRTRLEEVVNQMAGSVDGIILGCTDLPIALSDYSGGLRILDSADIASKAAVDRYFKTRGRRPALSF